MRGQDAQHGEAERAAAGVVIVGQTCEVSPGKLGSCVARDECLSPPCPSGAEGDRVQFVCQSQH